MHGLDSTLLDSALISAMMSLAPTCSTKLKLKWSSGSRFQNSCGQPLPTSSLKVCEGIGIVRGRPPPSCAEMAARLRQQKEEEEEDEEEEEEEAGTREQEVKRQQLLQELR